MFVEFLSVGFQDHAHGELLLVAKEYGKFAFLCHSFLWAVSARVPLFGLSRQQRQQAPAASESNDCPTFVAADTLRAAGKNGTSLTLDDCS